MPDLRRVLRRLLIACVALCLHPAAAGAQAAREPAAAVAAPVEEPADVAPAQNGPRLVAAATRPVAPAGLPAAPGALVAGNAGTVRPDRQRSAVRFVLDRVVVEGAHAVRPRDIAALWQARRGQTLDLDDVNALADAVGAAYRRAGFALYTVSVPAQRFADGILRLDVIEGYVAEVAIAGDTAGADMSLLRHYAAPLVADRPLHQGRLERAILLMNAIPGLQVGSRFAPVARSQGGVRLLLTVKRKRFDAGIGVNNQGFPLLGRSQFEANVVVNSLFQQGDRTQLTVGLPPERFETYQYVGLTEQQPLGNRGTTLTASAGALHTRTTGLDIDGNAVFANLQIAVPVIRRVHQTLTASVALDALDSDNALLGQTLTDERTRAVRLGVSYATDDTLAGGLAAVDSAGAFASQGIDALGARRGSSLVGGPAFTKLAARIERDQALPDSLVLRLKATGQVAAQRLPASEQFTYGGNEFGRAFLYDAIEGDSGVAGSAELAWRAPERTTSRYLAGSELFGFVDAGVVHDDGDGAGGHSDHGSSGGVGVRFQVLKTSVIQLEVAVPITAPRLLDDEAGDPAGVRLLFSVTSAL